MRLIVTKHDIGWWAANYIAKRVEVFSPTVNKPLVLALPTGGSVIGMYQHLVRLFQNGKISFENIISFNLDEYVGVAPTSCISFAYYMHHHLFKHVNIKPHNIHLLNGLAPDLDAECRQFERSIAECGGIDLLIGGVGTNGHIAFNEPFSSFASVTRVTTLDSSTIAANSKYWQSCALPAHSMQAPKSALTMGIKTILDAREVLIVASGSSKSLALHNALEGNMSSVWPVSALQMHAKVGIVCDEQAGYELKLKTIRYFAELKDEYRMFENELAKHE